MLLEILKEFIEESSKKLQYYNTNTISSDVWMYG